MFCSNCGFKMSDDDKFCPECGSPVESDIPASTDQNQQQEQVQIQQPAATQQPAAQIQPPQMTAPVQTAVKATKKGVKKGVIIGAVCGGTALVAAGAAALTLTSTGFLHSILGDQTYAQLVQTKYIGEVANKNKGIINTATTYAKAAGKAAGAASAIDRDQLNNDDYSYREASAVASAYAYMNGLDGLDTRNMSLTAGVELNVDDKLRDLIDKIPYVNSNVEDFVDASVKVANSTQVRIAQRFKDDEFAVSAYVLHDGDDIAGGVAHLNKKGELYFCMPEMTDKVLKYELPAYNDLFDESLKKPDVDEKKVMEFAEKVVKKMFDSYKDAEIEYTDGSVGIGDSEEKCTIITVTYENDNLADLLTDLADIAEDDDYINSLFENNDSYYYRSPVESVANMMRNKADELYSTNESVIFTAETYVKGNNDPIGMKLSLRYGTTELFRIESLDNDKDMSLKVITNNQKLLELTDEREGNAGEMTLKVNLDALNGYSSYSDSSDMRMTFRIKYSDLTTFKAFGREMTGGKFTVSIKSIPFLERSMYESISSGHFSFVEAVKFIVTNSITDMIKDGEIGFSLLPEGKGYKTTYSVGIKDYGSIGFYYILSPETYITDVNMSHVIDINDFDTDDAIDLTADITKYVLKKTGKDKEIQDLNDVIYLMTGVNILDMLENSDDLAVNYVSRFLPSSSFSNSGGRYNDYYISTTAAYNDYYATNAPATTEYYDTTRAANFTTTAANNDWGTTAAATEYEYYNTAAAVYEEWDGEEYDDDDWY